MGEVRSMDERRRPEGNRGETREHASAWKLGGLSITQLAKRVWKEMGVHRDDVFGRSAELAFYFFLAAFPLLIFFLTVFGLVVGNNPQVAQKLTESMSKMLPGSANQLLSQTIQQTALHSSGWLLVAGILGALWSGSSGFGALITTLNIVYDIKEDRPFWKERGIAIALTIVVGILILAAILVTLFGGWVATQLGSAVGLGGAVNQLWRIGQYAVGLFFVVLAFAVLYRWAPNRKEQKWAWLTPGAFFGVLLWVVASIALRVYLHYFNSYASSYGSVGAVIILMLWFYITGFAMLTGAEINAVVEDAAAQRGRADAQMKGEKRA